MNARQARSAAAVAVAAQPRGRLHPRHDLNAVAVLAYRDFAKFLRDRARVFSSLVFPFLFIALLGGTLQANLGPASGFDFLTFTFTGVLGMTFFQSTALGVISLVEDRENDFSQEIFVSPISRYSIVFGKIVGESLVAIPQGAAIVVFGLIIGVPMTPGQVVALVPAALACCLLGGAFGILMLSRLQTQRAANQIFPFVLLPQYFLAGIFNPITVLPWYLEILSRISPLRYAVDLTRNIFYYGTPQAPLVVLDPLWLDVVVMAGMFGVFLVVGTIAFVRNERNR